ncbi:IAA acetyltransferase protein [Candidatus Competibacter denitrificans Run_A_D11]|uniref:IAA acetyltransferase protein n=1 Tax=Candidatus Competibacter denitrificans Run_A_D11 TaxID=1400863 RepID=W6M3N1_9GAMM|nr:GNAT family N-acetyltransferase [Candidatus Competibacter denitrificans]CDI02351.1 IAA acetyltransferase protein [Candidatus Competibacter denitrificans Run_A_D11]HRC69656.1 GNAT family N-acetyltransferase [Candidatus Competibacter denitrificans]
MITIVPFSQHYVQGVVDLILSIQRLEFEIPITLEAQPDLQSISRFYQRGNGNFWVALDGEEIVGTLGLLDISNRQTALRKIFVKATHRGSKRGVAKQLLDTLIAWCQLRGVLEIYLGTTDVFFAAHRFYEKNGFQMIDRFALPASFPVMGVDSRFYCRTL